MGWRLRVVGQSALRIEQAHIANLTSPTVNAKKVQNKWPCPMLNNSRLEWFEPHLDGDLWQACAPLVCGIGSPHLTWKLLMD
jgi:hypothetical protein